MNESSKYRLLAKRSGVAGIVILASWFIAILFRFGPFDNPISWYVMRLADCLVVVLPIPTIIIGLWSARGLTRKDHSQDIGYAFFGILAGLLSIVAALLVLMYVTVHFD